MGVEWLWWERTLGMVEEEGKMGFRHLLEGIKGNFIFCLLDYLTNTNKGGKYNFSNIRYICIKGKYKGTSLKFSLKNKNLFPFFFYRI